MRVRVSGLGLGQWTDSYFKQKYEKLAIIQNTQRKIDYLTKRMEMLHRSCIFIFYFFVQGNFIQVT